MAEPGQRFKAVVSQQWARTCDASFSYTVVAAFVLSSSLELLGKRYMYLFYSCIYTPYMHILSLSLSLSCVLG